MEIKAQFLVSKQFRIIKSVLVVNMWKFSPQKQGVKTVIKRLCTNSHSWYHKGLRFVRQRKHWSEKFEKFTASILLKIIFRVVLI